MWRRGDGRVLTADRVVVRKDDRIKLGAGSGSGPGPGGGDPYSLQIQDLRADDQGAYVCEVDVLGKPISIEHRVSLPFPAK